MDDQPQVWIDWLADDLKQVYLNAGQRGLLYKALELVAARSQTSFQSWQQDINSKLYRHNLAILQQNQLEADLKVLEWFKFPEMFEVKGWLSKEPNYYATVMAAATLLQLYVQPVQRPTAQPQAGSPQPSVERPPQPSVERPPQVAAPGATTAGKSSPPPQPHAMASSQGETALLLALVVKSKDRRAIAADERVTVAELIKLVDGASYWLCAGATRLAEVREELAITEPLPPPDSEQEILILVTFNHREPLARDRRFSSKFALKQFLNKGISGAQVLDILKASRFDELMSFGFDRA